MTWHMRHHRDPLWWLFEAWGWAEESARAAVHHIRARSRNP